ncbi:MAG: class I SAM-dependent methyltransferase [Parcubacteria group bacterium]|nr:class I SAM-dependent methyltransferase [Parcubacteria group bacterium]
MVTGALLAKCSKIELSTADEKHYTLKNNFLNKLALRIIGLPHLGFRMRAKIILKEALRISKSSAVLDAGCGYGLYSMILAENGFNHIDAIDLDQKRIENINNVLGELPRLRPSIKTHIGSITKLPFQNESYDLIICSEVVEHIRDDISAIKELARVLKPNGTLILSVPYNSKYNQRIFKMFGHERPGYTKENLSTLLRPEGVEITEDKYYEYSFGTKLFRFFNSLKSKPLMGLFFYPCYILYLIDRKLAHGEPNGIIIVARKN